MRRRTYDNGYWGNIGQFGDGFDGKGGGWNKEGFGHVQASGVEGYSITVGLADGSKKAFSSATIAGFDKQATKALAMVDKKLAELKKTEVPSNGDPIESKVWTLPIETVKAMPVGEFNKAYAALEEENYHTENVVLMAKRRGTADDVAEAESLLKDQEAAGELTPELRDRRDSLMDKIASHSGGLPEKEASPEPTEPAEPEKEADVANALQILNDIINGKYGKDTKAIDKALDEAAAALEEKGLMEKYDALLNQAADALTVILKEKAKGVLV